MQWLSVGLVTKSSRDGGGFSKTNAPAKQMLVVNLWATLKSWMEGCLSGHWTTLLDYLQCIRYNDINRGRAVRTHKTLPSSYLAARVQFTGQRSAAEQNINAILSSDSSAFEDTKSLLETWVDSFEEGFAMNCLDRIELAASVWFSSTSNVTWHGKILDWAADMKRKALP